MPTRMVGVDSTDPRLPDDVINASLGTTHADLAPGDTLATAMAYADSVAGSGGGGGGEPGPPGPPGEPGIIVDDVPPDDHDVLWSDTSSDAVIVNQTVKVIVYTDESDLRPPDTTVVFWVPSPVTLGNPFAALPGDCVLRTSENPVQGLNGIDGQWKGTAAAYEALGSYSTSVVYYITAVPT